MPDSQQQSYGPPGKYPGQQPPGYPPQLPAELRLAEAYVPWQIYTNAYPPAEALQKGTLFPELYRPYRY